ncbi:Co2+/Mg2+ efflux protein ApaG [Paenimyroides aestuarii]|uniref:Co2+/Mg2+ efflux protein ApaG n=1 Tax=Paenimyroides aestuarii TaxID=2968490 RepID=A0ABY5NSQ7_9FLAO|nr:Co2+/Mg2+ efflux protein ApaG [Paenimyroides aestuarii]UUV21558.1 Co2+/Mg2+ efflux protein ApaG [Paenimyroides aestuarii]
MVSKITRGIKIIVKVKYVKQSLHLNNLVNFFNYEISIQNQGNDVVQLLRRCWVIKDSLNGVETVDGEGVIGKKPIVNPNETFQYTSGAYILGFIGSMQGYFTFVNFSNSQIFYVKIPLFNMSVPYIFN